MMTALWPLADMTDKMTSVHGSLLLPLFKSRSEAPTSLRDAFCTLLPTAFQSWLLYDPRQPRDQRRAHWLGPPRNSVTLSKRY
jgi:hypothetical protein